MHCRHRTRAGRQSDKRTMRFPPYRQKNIGKNGVEATRGRGRHVKINLSLAGVFGVFFFS